MRVIAMVAAKISFDRMVVIDMVFTPSSYQEFSSIEELYAEQTHQILQPSLMRWWGRSVLHPLSLEIGDKHHVIGHPPTRDGEPLAVG